MGLGGNIMWSPVVRELSKKHNKKVYLVRGTNCIWSNNPYITNNSNNSYQLDTQNPKFLYTDKTTNEKEDWKINEISTHIINWLLTKFDLPTMAVPKGELFITDAERDKTKDFIKRLSTPYITIEPHANIEWSPNKKSISLVKYQNIVNKLKKDIEVVQVSKNGMELLTGVKYIKDTSFRDVWSIIEGSSLFLSSEGGLVHAATALGVKSVVILQPSIPPIFVSYLQNININISRHPTCSMRRYCKQCDKDREDFDENIIHTKIMEYINK